MQTCNYSDCCSMVSKYTAFKCCSDAYKHVVTRMLLLSHKAWQK